MPPEPPLPKLIFTSDDSPRAGSPLATPIKPDHTPTVSGDAVPGATFGDNRTYNIPERSYSPSGRRPPLSRNSTEEEPLNIGIGKPTLTKSSPETPHDGIEKRIQRSRTEAVGASNSSWPTEPDPSKNLSKSHTVGPGKVRPEPEPDLGDQITTLMTNIGKIGLDEPKSYVPDEELSGLMTDRRIKKALEDPSKDLIDFAKGNPKLLAITLLVFENENSRNRVMEGFRFHKFTDSCLPVEEMLSEGVCWVQFNPYESDDSEDEPQCPHRSVANAFHRKPWKNTTFTTFFEKQWSFLVPKILEHVFDDYPFGKHIILPFENKNGDIGTKMPGGHFGDVRSARMLASYQTAIETVSILRLRSYDVEIDSS